jgi:hypothetical protein
VFHAAVKHYARAIGCDNAEKFECSTYSTVYAQKPDFPAFSLVSLFFPVSFNPAKKLRWVGGKEKKVYVVNKRQQSEKRRARKSMASKELPNFTFMAVCTHTYF